MPVPGRGAMASPASSLHPHSRCPGRAGLLPTGMPLCLGGWETGELTLLGRACPAPWPSWELHGPQLPALPPQREGSCVAEDDSVDIETENSTRFEEYEWCGQKRIRATTLLEGGFRGKGLRGQRL